MIKLSHEDALISDIELSEGHITAAFEFTKEVITVIRRARDVDKAVINEGTYIDIVVPNRFFLDDFNGSSYDKSIIEVFIPTFFKKAVFNYYSTYEEYVPVGEHTTYPLLAGGKVLIPTWCLTKKVVDIAKLEKEITKLQKTLSNPHYIANAPESTVATNRSLLATKVAKIIGCSDNALKKRMKKVGIL